MYAVSKVQIPYPQPKPKKTININGDLSQWDSVYTEYNHYEGKEDRDSSGWQGYYYKNDSFRNDIVKAKITYDSENIYFYVETADKLKSSDDSSWMRLLIGYRGYRNKLGGI